MLPASVLSCCDNVDASYLRVLLWLAFDLTLAKKPKQLAKLASCDARQIDAILSFWAKNGVLIGEEIAATVPVSVAVAEEKAPAVAVSPKAEDAEQAPKRHLQRADELPNYTSVELASLLEQRAGVRALIDEAQRILGKIFNLSEVNILVGMLDYLGMSEESVLLLLAYCKRIEKTKLRAIEKYAIELADREITTPAALEEEFRQAEEYHSFAGQVRSLFGMKARALTSRESKCLKGWIAMGYGIDVIRLAYEMTVNATNEPSVPYANAILERWNAEGWKTLEEIQAQLDAEKAKKEGGAVTDSDGHSVLGNSFDTDDFFEAALQRGFRERSEG